MDFIEDVSCVIVDEVHQAKADVLKDLLTSVFARVPLRWAINRGLFPKQIMSLLLYEPVWEI